MKDNRYRVFNKKWFKDNQRWLLYLLNHKVFKYYFREIFNMTGDCSYNERIIQIRPNGFSVYEKETKYGPKIRGMFFTGDVYSKIICYKFKEIWLLIHNWDTKIANKTFPSLNLGYDTFYPDGSPESTSVDGDCFRSTTSETFATIVGGNGSTGQDTATVSAVRLRASTTTNQFNLLIRAIALFDTSTIGSSSTITEAKMKVYGDNTVYQNLDGKEGDIVHCVGTSGINSNTAVIASDYQNAFDSTSFGTWTKSQFGTAGYSEITMNSSGEAAVSKTGVSKYGYIFGWDLSGSFGGTWSSAQENYVRCYTSDYTSQAYYEVLTVTYTGGTVDIHQGII